MMPVIPWIQPRQTVRKQQRFKKSNVPVKYIVVLSIAVFLFANLFFLFHVMDDDTKPIQRKAKQEGATATTTAKEQANACTFRHYPPHRYYKLQDKEELQPEFLIGTSAWSVDYIYGQWPLLLKASQSGNGDSYTQLKLCVDQSEWLPPSSTSSITDTDSRSSTTSSSKSNTKSNTNELPFADGTNPSILSVEHIHRHQKQFGTLDTAAAAADGERKSHWLEHHPAAAFIATVCMTNSQCRWKDSESQMQEYNTSRQDKAATVRTLILVLDADFAVLAQTTIFLQRDAQWGRRVKAAFDDSGKPVEVIKPLDDATFALDKFNAKVVWLRASLESDSF
jgi:hypothetical protein